MMTTVPDMKIIQDIYDRGVQELGANNFENAINILNEVDNHIDHYENSECIDILLKILSNRGFACLKLRNDAAAIEDFSNVLDHITIYQLLQQHDACLIGTENRWKSLSAKTLMRRALCYENIGEFQKALNDVNDLQQNYFEIFRNSSLHVQQLRILRRIEQDRNAAKEDGRPAWMAHAQQSLRLNIIRKLPQHLRLGQPFVCRLALGNELGLFDRNLFLRNNSRLDAAQYEMNDFVQCDVMALDQSQQQYVPTLQQLASRDEKVSNIGEDGKVKLYFVLVSGMEESQFPVSEMDILLRFSIRRYHDNRNNISISDVGNCDSSVSDTNTNCCMIHTETDILPVISIPVKLHFSASNGGFTSSVAADVAANKTRNSYAQLTAQISTMQINCLRPIKLPEIDGCPQMNQDIMCGESVGLLGIGGKIWDSTFILIQYLHLFCAQFVTNRRILELGAGTGITSLSLAHLSPLSVLCTDLEEVVPLIAVNFQLNGARSETLRNVIEERYCAEALKWGNVVSESALKCEVIIASDVVYYPEGYEPLLQTLERLLSLAVPESSNMLQKVCILAHRHRHPEDHKFFKMLSESTVLKTTEISWQADLLLSQTKQSTSNTTSSFLTDVRLFKITT